MRKQQKNTTQKGFTLIELLVVISIIALLSSVGLIGMLQARMKSRNAKRVADMTQMASVLELYFNTNKGYPSASTTPGVPDNLKPTFLNSYPKVPTPADGVCDGASLPNPPAPASTAANNYYYIPSGTPYTLSGLTLYPDYAYYFCVGDPTGNYAAGIHFVTPHGVQ